MHLQPSGSGSKYQGRNGTSWEHQGEALITWGTARRKCIAESNNDTGYGPMKNLDAAADGWVGLNTKEILRTSL